MALALLNLSCASGADAGLKNRKLVACSIPPQAYFIKQLLGQDFTVVTLMPAGANPEQFEPSIQLLRQLSQAQAFFALMHPHFAFEQQWVHKIRRQNPILRVYSASGLFTGFGTDPHVWLSPRLMKTYVDALAKQLSAAFPREAEGINQRHQSLRHSIDTLDAGLRRS